MKRGIGILVLLLSLKSGIAQVSDGFSDNNFSSNPPWSGEPSKFEVNVASQLHLNAPTITDTSYLSTPNARMDTTEWQFWLKMDFSPSTSNQLKAYLVSDQADLKSSNLNGYYLQLGATGSSDAIELYSQSGASSTLICSGIAGHCGKASNTLRIKVRRDLIGNWTIWSDTLGGHNFIQEAAAFDNTFLSTGYFGFKCLYTSTRSDKFYFDDVYIGSNVIDVIPPQLLLANISGLKFLDVQFDEDLSLNSAQNIANYNVTNGLGLPINAVRDATNLSLVHLQFFNGFTSGNYQLSVSNISDLIGNVLNNATTNFSYHVSQAYDIVIDELMADPTPVVALPNYEYIELYNRSGADIDLKDWTIGDSSNSYSIVNHSSILKADSFLILCSGTASTSFLSYGKVQTPTSFPSLNNTGDVVLLHDQNRQLIHSVSFTDAWYQSNSKKMGGWSLEMLDVENPCASISNWRASSSATGGTPGKTNAVKAVNPDTEVPVLERAYVQNDSSILLLFNEGLQEAIALINLNYTVQPSLGNILQVHLLGYDRKEIQLVFANKLQINTLYKLIVNAVSDCSGNAIGSNNHSYFGIPLPIDSGDIVINEILFNPKPNNFDFVELYNQTDKILDVSELSMANRNSLNQIDNIYPVSTSPYLFFPKTYLVVTEDKAAILQQYTSHHTENFVEAPTMPSLNDDEGSILITKQSGAIIDEVNYSEKWHFPLLNDKEGVSLERISFTAPSQDAANWHSAASVVGFGTPADENSQMQSATASSSNSITLEPKIVSPDNDGHDDFLLINYQYEQAGMVANIQIYDAEGRFIKTLAANETLAQKGFFTWDGTDEKSAKLAYGIYVVYVEVFDLQGKVIKIKKDCVLAGNN